MVSIPGSTSVSPSMTPYGTPETHFDPFLSTPTGPPTDSLDPSDPWEEQLSEVATRRNALVAHLRDEEPFTEQQILNLNEHPDALNESLRNTWKMAEQVQSQYFCGLPYLTTESYPEGAKDRYSNIHPYFYNHLCPGRPNAPYINGSRVRLDQLKLLLTQGPTDQDWADECPGREETVGDFWHLIYKEQPKWVVSLTKARDTVTDPKTNKQRLVNKCAAYWDCSSFTLDDASSIHKDDNENAESKDLNKLRLSTFRVKNSAGEELRAFHHALYLAWPDHGVPEKNDRRILAQLAIRLLDEAQNDPVLLQCSAGVGRTGAFALTLYLLQQLRQSHSIFPLRALTDLRMQRRGCVQSPLQFKLVFLLLADALQILAERERVPAPAADPNLRA